MKWEGARGPLLSSRHASRTTSAMIELLILLGICGVILWFVNQYVPMAPPFKTAINIVVVLGLVLYLLNFFGITHFNFHTHRY